MLLMSRYVTLCHGVTFYTILYHAIQGDSGGPLTYKEGAQHVLIGDVSFGDGCAKAGRYGVYGRISFYRNWLDSKMTMAKFCSLGGPNVDEELQP